MSEIMTVPFWLVKLFYFFLQETRVSSPIFEYPEVADFLRKFPKRVYTKKNLIPGYFKTGGSIFFNREILLSHLFDLAFKPT